jgi:NACHT domain
MEDSSPPPPADNSEPNPRIGQNVNGNGNQVIGKAINSIIVNGKVVYVTIIQPVLKNLLPPPIEVVRTLTTQNEIERQILLTKVRSRVNRRLARSLHKIAEIELGLEDCVGLVQQDDDDADFSDVSRDVLPQGTQAIDIFDRNSAGRTLAIFGEPGSGKTIMLLKLAEEMISRTEQDSGQPIPIVFNLSSWTIKPQSIEQWLIEEIDRKYGFGKASGKNWVETQALMLFLDGLDEVKVDRRNDCVEALNEFMKNHTTTEIVICCRIGDYEKLDARLSLQNAICIQPLNSQQINEYLDRAGEQLSALKTILPQDTVLQKLAKTPLLLSIMSLTYKGFTPEQIPLGGSLEDSRKRLFTNYVDEMFQRRVKLRHRNWIDWLFKRRRKKKKEPKYHREDTERWLIWLAQQMKVTSQSEFLIEGLQPSCLQTWEQRMCYRLGIGLLYGFIGTIFGLETTLVNGLFFGSIFGIWALIFHINLNIKPVETLRWNWNGNKNDSYTGNIIGLLFAIFNGLRELLQSKLVLGGMDYLDSFHQGEEVGRLIGSLISLPFSWWLGGMIFILIGGFRGPKIQDRDSPNQGIFSSTRNALIVGAIVFLIICLLSYSSIFNVLYGAELWGLILGLFYGGNATIRHFVLRLFIYRKRYAPWDYARFLDYASEKLFLQKAGGIYTFVHPMLRDHFAEMSQEQRKR